MKVNGKQWQTGAVNKYNQNPKSQKEQHDLENGYMLSECDWLIDFLTERLEKYIKTIV